MRAADVEMVRTLAHEERGGVIGQVQRLIQEEPGLLTRDIVKRLQETGQRVSGALNKLKLDGLISQQWEQHRCRWLPSSADSAARPRESDAMRVDAHCRCGAWIIWGSLATDEDRADPRCGSFPFAARGVA